MVNKFKWKALIIILRSITRWSGMLKWDVCFWGYIEVNEHHKMCVGNPHAQDNGYAVLSVNNESKS